MNALKTESSVPKLNVKLRFDQSPETGNICAYVRTAQETGLLHGCNPSVKGKKIVLVDKCIVRDIIPHVMYYCEIVPMREKKGYIAVSAEAVQYNATIEVSCVKHAVYTVAVKWGGKTVTYDPFDGTTPRNRSIGAIIEMLEKRVDIYEPNRIIREFTDAATKIDKFMELDGVSLNRFKRKIIRK